VPEAPGARIGIDVGGTNTDAVLMEGTHVRAAVKTATTPDVGEGIVTALRQLVAESAVHPSSVRAVMIGTTHFVNAVVEARRLMPAAIVRLGLPATAALPPLLEWPQRLRAAISAQTFICHGGHEFDGRPISPLDRDELLRTGKAIREAGIDSVAISSVFSPINADFEREAAAVLAEELPGAVFSLSHEIGRMGLLERENAATMNAALRGLAEAIVQGFASAVAENGIDAPIFLSQNDGTLMTIEFAERYPVATFASGPTNSMRGAAFLSGETDCAVVDVGGTTTDVGILRHGFPREASAAVEVGGVRTNFRMPDVHSFGLGGGSLVLTDDGFEVGPQSVGYELVERALVFGGDTLTATDLAVAGGLAEIGDPERVAGLDSELVRAGLELMERRVAEAVDRMKTSADPVPVVLVGGGSILIGDRLQGASRIVRPEHFAVANAIGAAIAQVGGEVDKVVSLSGRSRADALDEAKSEAVEKAVAAGATPGTVEVIDVDEMALGYMPGNAVRIRIKAVGDLALA
jgi:N-methylhydantoinase A/oxoprolinase/acetone carboxylase beta subunit